MHVDKSQRLVYASSVDFVEITIMSGKHL